MALDKEEPVSVWQIIWKYNCAVHRRAWLNARQSRWRVAILGPLVVAVLGFATTWVFWGLAVAVNQLQLWIVGTLGGSVVLTTLVYALHLVFAPAQLHKEASDIVQELEAAAQDSDDCPDEIVRLKDGYAEGRKLLGIDVRKYPGGYAGWQQDCQIWEGRVHEELDMNFQQSDMDWFMDNNYDKKLNFENPIHGQHRDELQRLHHRLANLRRIIERCTGE